jgi:catechol 2,3-dioxygenase-like lactoylglutathione lyase family enzyme
MNNRLDHVALIVGDLDAAISFYRDRMQLGTPLRLDVPEAQLRLAFFVTPGAAPFELVEFGGRGELAHGDAVIAFEVDDLDSEIARLRSAGTHVFEQPATDSLPFRRGWITKPNGHGTVIELCERGKIAELLASIGNAAEPS